MTDRVAFEAQLMNIADLAEKAGAKNELTRILNLLSIEMRVQLLGDPNCEPAMTIKDVVALIIKGQTNE
jgi:hypothetical protein